MGIIKLNIPADETENAVSSADTNEPVCVKTEESESESALAKGLPSTWSIEPPAIVVRRKARTL